ncbi:MAG: sigma-70 family RNA polymerase sigma factor [Candidatus Kapabacteria bacterium]|nr:sigma-70 family RNA polymerase sigma factor [Candidatus Kapabacteria bacterium]MDW8011985.1 sigma-70 family RNA polymerase sigma factor [Bacteroidota bacterium]
MGTRRQQLSPQELQQVWQRYWEGRSDADRQRLILHYRWLVRYAVHSLRLPEQSLLSEEDLEHTGILGLNEAIERFDPKRGTKFETYALTRIRGAILDELRKLDWLSRTARRKLQAYQQAADLLQQERGGEVSTEDVRQRLGLSPEAYRSYLHAVEAAYASLSLHDSQCSIPTEDEDEPADPAEELPDSTAVPPAEQLCRQQLVNAITAYLERLPERKRLVIVLLRRAHLPRDRGAAPIDGEPCVPNPCEGHRGATALPASTPTCLKLRFTTWLVLSTSLVFHPSSRRLCSS